MPSPSSRRPTLRRRSAACAKASRAASACSTRARPWRWRSRWPSGHAKVERTGRRSANGYLTAPDRLGVEDGAMDRTTIRDLIEAGRARFDDAVAGLSDAAMLERIDDEWTRKDVLAHVEAWERRVVQLFEALRAGGRVDETYETD